MRKFLTFTSGPVSSGPFWHILEGKPTFIIAELLPGRLCILFAVFTRILLPESFKILASILLLKIFKIKISKIRI
jgi:hypothetical protein